MTVFLVIGAVGLVALVAALVFGELLDGLLDGLDLDAGGVLSGPVLASFLAAFGFGGALATGVWGGVAAGILGGLVGGLAVGAVSWLLVRSLARMPTDASFRTADLVGVRGTVLTPVPDGGLGEVTLRHLGQLAKLSARADRALPAGAPVVVTAVTSPTSVVVAPVEEPGDH